MLDAVTFCCSCGSFGDYVYRNGYKGELIEYEDFLAVRNKLRERFINGSVPERCKSCADYEIKNWRDTHLLNYVCIAHRSKCSCNCFYCYFSEKKQYWNTREVYNIAPVFKHILNTFPLQYNFIVNLVGGECSEYPEEELNTIIDETIKHEGLLQFTTSGIFFNEKIAQTTPYGNISVSPDAGTKETYEKIKRVKCFDQVWENIRKYSIAAKTDIFPHPVRIKYIIIPGINDNKAEFKAFAQKCMALKNTMIEISLEYKWFEQNSDKPLTNEMIDFLSYIQSYENKIHIAYKEAAVPFLRKIRTDFKIF